jgi:hypothetical protein
MDARGIAEGLSEADVGQMFSVPWSPNPHKLEWIRPRYCSLHGEFIGMEAGFLKRRNSEIRPWGSCIHVVMANDTRITRQHLEVKP